MFEWDEDKNRSNILKHGISFPEAVRIFEGRTLTEPDDRRDYGEQRLRSVGVIGALLIVVVVHTDRDGRSRIISARRANRKERQRYETEVRQGTHH